MKLRYRESSWRAWPQSTRAIKLCLPIPHHLCPCCASSFSPSLRTALTVLRYSIPIILIAVSLLIDNYQIYLATNQTPSYCDPSLAICYVSTKEAISLISAKFASCMEAWGAQQGVTIIPAVEFGSIVTDNSALWCCQRFTRHMHDVDDLLIVGLNVQAYVCTITLIPLHRIHVGAWQRAETLQASR